MRIELYPPLALHEKGQRPQNEDSIFPQITDGLKATVEDRLFIVCDGVGGAEKGEEASKIACGAFAASLRELEAVYEHDLLRALEMAEVHIDAYIESNPEADGMATTLALLVLDQDGAKMVHIGDSRVYHIRAGKILLKTHDHSLVNEMVENNIISEEEARNHPKRNVVSRAIAGRQRPTKMDCTTLVDIRPGDYFFLCTDGILESISDEALSTILAQTVSDELKMSEINQRCQQFSKDNFSAYLIRIKDVKADNIQATDALEQHQNKLSKIGILPKWVAYLLIFVFVLTVLMLLFTLLSM